jgi:hypothetical protein
MKHNKSLCLLQQLSSSLLTPSILTNNNSSSTVLWLPADRRGEASLRNACLSIVFLDAYRYLCGPDGGGACAGRERAIARHCGGAEAFDYGIGSQEGAFLHGIVTWPMTQLL